MIFCCLFASGLDRYEIMQIWKLGKCNLDNFYNFYIIITENEPSDNCSDYGCSLVIPTLVSNID